MSLKKITICFLALVCCLWAKNVLFGASIETLQMEKQEYEQDLSRIGSLRKSLKPGPTNDLKSFEKFADEIQRKWRSKDPEHYAKLMLEICGPITSGRFNTDDRFNIARKYALTALTYPNKITLETELELTGHVKTPMFGPPCTKRVRIGRPAEERRGGAIARMETTDRCH